MQAAYGLTDLTSTALSTTGNSLASKLASRIVATTEFVQRRLAFTYFCFATITISALALTIPPFQNPDELSHFQRIDQITQGRLIGERFGRAYSGGWVDGSIEQAYAPFALLPFHPERKVSAEMLFRANRLAWSGTLALNQFPNTAIYPPFCYLPAVATVMVGKWSGLSVVDTLHLTRLVNGLVAVLVATAAIAAAGVAAPVLFAVLTLPMALGQMAAVSQDGLILALMALAVALTARTALGQSVTRRRFTALCLCLAAASSARPPYAPLALIILALPNTPWRWRLTGTAVVVAIIGGWSLLAATLAQVVIEQPDVFPNPAAQLSQLLAEPMRIPQIAAATLKTYFWSYSEQFIGLLGWFDVTLPRWLHAAAAGNLVLAMAATLVGRIPVTHPLPPLSHIRTAALGGILLATAAIFGIQYVTWTDVGGVVVLGVQGRYFIPLALVCALLVLPFRSGGGDMGWTRASQRILLTLVVALPFLYVPTLIKQVWERYYLQPERLLVRTDHRMDPPRQQAGSLDIASRENTPDGEPALVELSGWTKLSVDDPTHSLTIVSPSRITVLSAVSVERPDVAAHFRDPSLQWSGFTITLTMDPPPPAGQRPPLCIVSDDAKFGRFLVTAPTAPQTGTPPCAEPLR